MPLARGQGTPQTLGMVPRMASKGQPVQRDSLAATGEPGAVVWGTGGPRRSTKGCLKRKPWIVQVRSVYTYIQRCMHTEVGQYIRYFSDYSCERVCVHAHACTCIFLGRIPSLSADSQSDPGLLAKKENKRQSNGIQNPCKNRTSSKPSFVYQTSLNQLLF